MVPNMGAVSLDYMAGIVREIAGVHVGGSICVRESAQAESYPMLLQLNAVFQHDVLRG
jgi:hypothetical protein